jgi:glycosyltransferase involved in cell wall biosynthesis
MAKAPERAPNPITSIAPDALPIKGASALGTDVNPARLSSLPTADVVCATLCTLGVIDAASAPRLESLARNPERRDYLTRATFNLYAGDRAICHLTVGKNLEDLHARTQTFADACSSIACLPLFWHQSAGWDYLGIELFQGKNLETLVLEGRLKPADAIAHVAKIVSALEGTTLPSTAEAASEEIEQFFSRACASPIFSGLDQQFLQSAIFPFIRNGALSGRQQTRWTNGDLIARNVLADSQGCVRLVDYEFAGRTHFFAEDSWRWRSLSMLPPEALDLPGSPKASTEPWLEAYFILRHAVLIHEINGAAVAVSGLRQQMDRLVSLAAAANTGFRASVFFQPLASPQPKPSAAPAQGAACAQLYWGSDEAYCEERSQRLRYPINQDAKLAFMLHSMHGVAHLRFDPAEAPGLLKVSAIRVRIHGEGTPLFALDETTGWEGLQMGNDLLRLGDSPALNLLSLDGDPNLSLPEIAIGDAPHDAVCEVWLRFTPELAALPDLLRPLSSALVARAKAEAGLAQATAQIATLESKLAEARHDLQTREQDLATIKAKAETESAAHAQAEAALAEARQVFAALTEQHARIDEQLRQANATIEALQASSAQATAQIATLESKLAEARNDLQTREKDLVTIKAKAETESAARAQAEAALAKARKTLAALEEALHVERIKVSVGRWQQFLLNKQLSETLPGLQAAQERSNALDAAIAQQQRELQSLSNQLKQREDKIARMQRSFSWKSTTTLRWLRRRILDQPAPQPQPPAPLKTLWCIDTPFVWEAAPGNGEIVGWCIYPDGRPIRGIRGRFGSNLIVDGKYGLYREDVAAAHGFGGAESRDCGFAISYDLPVDCDYAVKIEVLGEDDQWHPLTERVLHTSSRPREVQDYTAWVAAFDTMSEEKVEHLRRRIAGLAENRRPLISVLMPVYNTPKRWLDRAIESVVAQVYPNWELCIADDASPSPEVRQVLEKWKEKDARIRVTYREANGHISIASNSALELAQGEFVALVDHDDEVPVHALAEIVFFLADHPETDVVYSDEDKIDENGVRLRPYFKPDFMPDLLFGQNCVSHFAAYRTELVRRVGGFRAGYEGSQDWDLVLRVCEASSPGRIGHVPKILYHWRIIAGSTSLEISSKSYAVDSARRALADHFKRRGIKTSIEPVPGSNWQIVYPLPDQCPLVSIIIPTRNRADLVRLCVASIIARTSYSPYEIILVDNHSDDPEALSLFKQLAAEPNVRVVRYEGAFNYSAINNFAVHLASGELVCLLNNDIEAINEAWLTEMVSHAVRPEIGAVGAKLFYPNGRIQHAGVVLGLNGVAGHAFAQHPRDSHGYWNRARVAQNYSAVTAACMVVRKQVFEKVGGLNEKDLPVAFNDVDFCLRVREAGYRNLWTPFAQLYHHESISRGKDDTPAKLARAASEVDYMRRKWGSLLDRDPAYNPNLALSVRGFDLAWPPR